MVVLGGDGARDAEGGACAGADALENERNAARARPAARQRARVRSSGTRF